VVEIALAIASRMGFMAGALGVTAGMLTSLVFLLRRPWWPTLIFQTGLRPREYVPWQAGTFAGFAIFGYALLGNAGFTLMTLVWFVFAPAIVVPRATRRIWAADSEDDRAAALAIRNRMRAAAGEAELDGSNFWSQYVLDRARADRQAQYRPPGV
jgi:hypothetical protein